MRYGIPGLILVLISATPLAYAQEAIFLVRHAEQVHDVDDPPLTEVGLRRAKAWATLFRDAGIKMIYTSKKARTRQTGEAIAQGLNIPLETTSRRDVSGLVNQVRSAHTDDVVLIVSHSKTIPRLVKEFAPFAESPLIEQTDYDSLFLIVPTGKNDATVLRLRY